MVNWLIFSIYLWILGAFTKLHKFHTVLWSLWTLCERMKFHAEVLWFSYLSSGETCEGWFCNFFQYMAFVLTAERFLLKFVLRIEQIFRVFVLCTKQMEKWILVNHAFSIHLSVPYGFQCFSIVSCCLIVTICQNSHYIYYGEIPLFCFTIP